MDELSGQPASRRHDEKAGRPARVVDEHVVDRTDLPVRRQSLEPLEGRGAVARRLSPTNACVSSPGAGALQNGSQP